MFLHAVSEKTSATLDLNKLDIITSTAFRLTQGRCCALFLMDRDRKYTAPRVLEGRETAGHGPDRVRSRREHLRLGRGQGVPLLINDVSQNPGTPKSTRPSPPLLSVP